MSAKLVVVTGSGRSGTSSVAGALKRLGLFIPPPEAGVNEFNPKGYYEPLWVTDFHKRLLDGVRVRTIDARPSALDEARAAAREPEVRQRLRAWLAEQLDHPQILIKDPREFWVHELWLDVAAELGADLVTLTMLRHPTEVARSRDTAYLAHQTDQFRRLRETANVAAWINAAVGTEEVTRPNRRAFVRYDDLVADWRTTLGRAVDQLGLDVDATAFSGAPHEIDDFIDPALQRSHAQWDELAVGDSLRALGERAWQATNRLVEDPHGAAIIEELSQVGVAYRAMYAEAEALTHDATSAQVAGVRRRLKSRVARQEEELARLRARGWRGRLRRHT